MACATQPPIVVTEYEILRLTKKIYVPINKKLTAPTPIEYVSEGSVDTIDLKVTIQACQTRIKQCNGDKASIDKVQGTVLPEEEQ